jgi:hypothetical protein
MPSPYIILGTITTNTVDGNGVHWIQGLIVGMGATGGTLSPVQKPRAAGAWAGDSYAKGRSFVINGTVAAPTALLAQQALDSLNVAATLAPTPLVLVQDIGSRTYMARRDGEVLPTWINTLSFQWSVQFFAPDPRTFSTVLTQVTNESATSGGFILPFTVPLTITSTIVSGLITMTNLGNESGPVILRIDGPAHGPIVTHTSPSGAVQVFALVGLNLVAGEYLVIDMERRTVIANGTASRNGYVSSRGWSQFEPGVNSWQFTASSADAAAALTVTATPSFK